MQAQTTTSPLIERRTVAIRDRVRCTPTAEGTVGGEVGDRRVGSPGRAGPRNAAVYIGRVGALALALGVGAAIVTSTGAARADDTVGPKGAEGSSASDHPPTPAGSEADSDGRRPPSPTVSKKPDDAVGTVGAQPNAEATPVDGDVPGRSSPGHAESSTTASVENPNPRTDDEPASPPAVAGGDPTSAQAPSSTPEAEPAPPTAVASAKRTAGVEHVTATESNTFDPRLSAATTATPPGAAAAVTVAESSPNRGSAVAVDPGGTGVSEPDPAAPAAVAAAAVTPPIIAPGRPAVAAPSGLMAVVANVVTALLSPFSGASPAVPAAEPSIFTLLAWVRREFFNASPTITPRIDPQANGLVTGNVGAADADGDALTFSYLGQPMRGGSVVIDPVTGDFTYTPTAKMLQYGGFDQFNVVVSDTAPGAVPRLHGPVDLIGYLPVVGPLITGALQVAGIAGPYTDAVPRTITVTVTPTTPVASLSGDAATLSRQAVTTSDDWRSYVLTPAGPTARPKSVYYVDGDVTNVGGIAGGQGSTTLTYLPGGKAPVVIVDYGIEVGGYSNIAVTSATPNILQTAFSETAENMSPIGDGSGSTLLVANSGNPLTFELVPVAGAGQWESNQIQGGFRYQMITLTVPGTVTLTGVGTRISAPLTPADEYAGHFLSNSDLLNRIWYQGAYTLDLSTIAAGTPGFFGPYDTAILGEAAKRDRAVWAGDLLIALGSAHDVFGAAGDALNKANLSLFADNPVGVAFPLFPSPFFADPAQGPAGGVCRGTASTGCSFYSASYSMHFVQNMANYYTVTGDTDFIRQNYAQIQRELAYERSLINPMTGLVSVPLPASLDFSVGVHPGETAAANMLHYNSLISGAALATAVGDSVSAAQYAAEAAATKNAVNTRLWNPISGAYDPSTAERGLVVQDANTYAVLYGVASDEQAARIVQTLADRLSTPYGLRIADPTAPNLSLGPLNLGYQPIVSPFASGLTLRANYAANRPDLAIDQITTLWGYMANNGPASTTWEKINLPAGNLATSFHLFSDSAAHAWSTGATSALSDYVLGVTPTAPGYRQWQVKPYVNGLTWAQGQVPTAGGAIESRWELGDDAYRLTVAAPPGTVGAVAVPTLGQPRMIYLDGQLVWDGTGASAGITATSGDDGFVTFSGVTGEHTWAWSG